MGRLEYHLDTDKSKISENIYSFCFVLDQLHNHLIAKQVIPFIKLVDKTMDMNIDVKKCIRKTPHDNGGANEINEYQNIVADLWNCIIAKTKSIAIQLVEDNLHLESTAQIQEIKVFLNKFLARGE